MNLKKYKIIKLITTIILAIIFSQSIIYKNYFIPIIALIISSALLIYLRKKVPEIINDERDFAIGGKAALLTIQVYSWTAVIVMFISYSLRDLNSFYEPVAMTLAFSTCVLMISYSLIFKYYNKITYTNKKNFIKVFASIMFVILFIIGLRIYTGEDTWICKDGVWVEHGKPDFPMPINNCN